MPARRDARGRREVRRVITLRGLQDLLHNSSCSLSACEELCERVHAELIQSCDIRPARRAGVRRMTESAQPRERLKLHARPQGPWGGGLGEGGSGVAGRGPPDSTRGVPKIDKKLIQKINKKRYPQKTTFFRLFGDFCDFSYNF